MHILSKNWPEAGGRRVADWLIGCFKMFLRGIFFANKRRRRVTDWLMGCNITMFFVGLILACKGRPEGDRLVNGIKQQKMVLYG